MVLNFFHSNFPIQGNIFSQKTKNKIFNLYINLMKYEIINEY